MGAWRRPRAPRRAQASDPPAQQSERSSSQAELHPGDGAAAVRSTDEPQLTFGQHAAAFVRELAVVVVGAIVVASLLRGFVGQMFLIPSISMEDTLRKDDRVVVEKFSGVARGQVVVFEDPGGWLTGPSAEARGPIGRVFQAVGVLPDTSTEHLIKRVVAVGGDTVVCCDDSGRITVNGQPLDETPYLYAEPGGEQVQPSLITFSVVVPKDRLFVLGDSREHSRDSRCHLNDVRPGVVKGENAFVSENRVVGRARAVVWPWSRQHKLAVPGTFATVPAGRQPAPGTPDITAGPEANC